MNLRYLSLLFNSKAILRDHFHQASKIGQFHNYFFISVILEKRSTFSSNHFANLTTALPVKFIEAFMQRRAKAEIFEPVPKYRARSNYFPTRFLIKSAEKVPFRQ